MDWPRQFVIIHWLIAHGLSQNTSLPKFEMHRAFIITNICILTRSIKINWYIYMCSIIFCLELVVCLDALLTLFHSKILYVVWFLFFFRTMHFKDILKLEDPISLVLNNIICGPVWTVVWEGGPVPPVKAVSLVYLCS